MSAALLRAARAVANVFSDAEVAHETGPTLTCGEADALARLMVAAGETTAAADWTEQGDVTTPTGSGSPADPVVTMRQAECERCLRGVEGYSDTPTVWRDRSNGTTCAPM